MDNTRKLAEITNQNLSCLREKHGSYDSEYDKKWHTIGELDLMVEQQLLGEQSTPDYGQFLETKKIVSCHKGIEASEPNPKLFGFQRDIVRWALRKGRAAIFADCGLGKTLMQLEWARQVPGRVLILAPLAVAQQTVREAKKIDLEISYARNPTDSQITVTNYQMLEHFRPEDYAGIVLDESSILKSFEGHFRNRIINSFFKTKFRLACTATPAARQ